MKNKKFVSSILAVVLSFSVVLTGCGGSKVSSENESSGNNSTESTPTQSIAGTADPIAELVSDGEIYECHVTWPSMGQTPADIQEVEEALYKILEPKIGVHIVLDPVGLVDLQSQQSLLISSGDPIDIVSILWTGISSYVNSEALYPLDDIYPTYAPDIDKSLGELVKVGYSGGHLYAVSNQNIGHAYGFDCRSDLLEKYGFGAEDRQITIDELENILATVKAGEGNDFYCFAGGANFAAIDGRFDVLGGNLYDGGILLDEPEKVVNLIATDEYKALADRAYNWANKGYFAPDAATATDSLQVLFGTGKYFGVLSFTDPGNSAFFSNTSNYGFTSLTIQPGYTCTSDMQSVMWGIAASSQNPKKALLCLNEICTNLEVMTLLGFGIEGKHYVVKDTDGTHKILDFPEGVDATNSGYYVTLGVWGLKKIKPWFAPTTLDFFKEIEEAQKTFEISPAYGFVFDSREYTTEITALSSVYSQYNNLVNAGAMDPTQLLPEYLKALEDAGINTVLEAKQAQYSAWLAEQ